MDEFFGSAFTDVDEWRDAPRRHRYVHGGFEGTDTRFSFYFPESPGFGGRFLQFLQGGFGGNEHQAPLFAGLDIAFENGAYLVESNQGHIGNDLSGLRGDSSILAFRASAQAARFAREVGREMYGEAPGRGYVFGGSGGANRAVSCLENVTDVWDGAVPFMLGHGAYYHYNWSVLAYAETVLRDKIAAIVDAVEPGGSGDPFAVLETDQQRGALATLYRAGYPRGAEKLIGQVPLWIFTMQRLLEADPGFFDDFWTEPGYAGFEGEPGLAARRVEEKAIVRRAVRAADLPGYGTPSDDMNLGALLRVRPDLTAGIVIEPALDPGRILGARVRILSGAAAGRELLCSGAIGEALVAVFDPVDFEGVEAGDEVLVDNRDFLAFCHYHRHLVDHRYPEMRQLFTDGKPMYPQRDLNLDARGAIPSGRFAGRMIVVQHAQDRECWPNGANAFAQLVRENLRERTDERFRLWWIDNAAHLPPLTKAGRTRLINYVGCFAQAVRDLIAWVEDGTEPPPSTRYEIEGDGHLVLPTAAAERAGIQPVVSARVGGASRAEARVGETVRFEGFAEAPPGAGTIVRAEWDFDESGSWPARDASADGATATVRVEASHAYERPGTYFATFRVASQREGSTGRGVRLVQALARVRVVVR